jgi:hypothetical protein
MKLSFRHPVRPFKLDYEPDFYRIDEAWRYLEPPNSAVLWRMCIFLETSDSLVVLIILISLVIFFVVPPYAGSGKDIPLQQTGWSKRRTIRPGGSATETLLESWKAGQAVSAESTATAPPKG